MLSSSSIEHIMFLFSYRFLFSMFLYGIPILNFLLFFYQGHMQNETLYINVNLNVVSIYFTLDKYIYYYPSPTKPT